MLDWINSRLKQLGEFRDSFLVLAGSLYILGYFVRSINALRNNLGLLPAFEAQYLIAGIVPALILLLFYFSIWCIWQFKKKLPAWLDSGEYRIIIVFLITIAYFASISVIVFDQASDDNLMVFAVINLTSAYLLFSIFLIKSNTVKGSWRNFRDKKNSWFLRIVFLLAFLITAIPYGVIHIIDKIIAGTGRQIKESIDYVSWVTVFVLIMLTLSGLENFMSKIYPKIPQELGGEQPRCAYVDVIGAEISPEIQAALFSSNTTNTDIIQSIPLDVYFANNEFLLVKPRNNTSQVETVTYEIQKSVVRAITWCK